MKTVTHPTFGEPNPRTLLRRIGATAALTLALFFPFASQALAQRQQPTQDANPVAGQALGPFEFNGDLGSLPNADMDANARHKPLRPQLHPGRVSVAPKAGASDPLLPYSSTKLASPAPFTPPPFIDFDGTPGGDPPDTNGVVGPNHYIQTINVVYKIWDKNGAVLAGPTSFTTLFAASPATGTPCDNGFTSDPVVLYDPLADRFILTILAFQGFQPPPAPPRTPIPPFYECIAVAKTSNPVTGGWYKYALLADNADLNDFPKLGVWPDAYYMSANMFPPSGNAFPRVWALDRNSILVGGLMHEVHFDVPDTYWSLLPSNLHGSPPPAGAPNVFASVNFNNDNKVFLWNFHVDFVTPSNSTFGDGSHNPDHTVNVAAYTHLTQNIPQPGTAVVSLDALADRLNYPAQYRKIGGTQSLWLDHPVDTGGNVSGVRWYEIRDPAGAPALFQQGTWNNLSDGVQRWMGAIGADQFGNMAVGYNVSDATSTFPGIRYAGRAPGDPLGLLGLGGEQTLIAGGSNIINCTPDASKGETTCVGRWGDYSGMSVDPVDDCTFWFTGEYVTGGNNRTRIGAFAMPGCDADVSVVKSAPATVAAGTNLSYSITVANGGPVAAQFVKLTDATPPGTTFVGLAQNSGPTFTCTTPIVGGTGTVNCTVAVLASGDSATFTLIVKVAASAPGPIVNTATVDSDPLDPNPGNNSSTVSTVVIQSADLRITKTCKPDTAQLVGVAAFCDIVVTNLGPSAAQNVVITDAITSNVSFTITSAAASPIACSPPIATPIVTVANATTTLTCSIGTLGAGASDTLHVVYGSDSAGDINDTATVTSSTPDPDLGNNQATGHVRYATAADVSITKAAAPNPVVAGTSLTYTITVSNAGPSVAGNVVMKDTIPAEVSVLTVVPSVGSCTAGFPGNPLQPLTCTLGSLAVSGSATVVVVTRVNPGVPDGTVINNNATVSSDAFDTNNANNSATAAVTVNASADVAIVKTSDKPVYKPSKVVTYTIKVTNNGPSDALAVIVTDNLPAIQQAIYQSDTGGCVRNALTPTILTCTLGNMPVGTSRSFDIYERINGSQGQVVNTASVVSATSDPDTSNNVSSLTVTIGK